MNQKKFIEILKSFNRGEIYLEDVEKKLSQLLKQTAQDAMNFMYNECNGPDAGHKVSDVEKQYLKRFDE